MTYTLKILGFVASLFALSMPAVVGAQGTQGKDPMKQVASAVATSAEDVVNGEVRKIDKGAKKITLRHGEMPNLEMPAMTMVFQVKDPAFLDAVKVGDKVKFKAQKIGGALVVVEIQPSP